ncbi:Parp3, partial [Symbiodinium microadriaticum]
MAQLDNGTEVAVDGNDIYDVALSQIDLSKNMDKYYIIQLLVIPPKKRYEDETYAVFTRWGKTGNAGQNMTSGPYDDLEDAITEFKDKFYSKTKNDWDDRHNFQAKKNQYKLIRVDHASKAARVSAARSGQVPKWEYYVDDFVDGKAVGWYPYTADGAEGAEDLWVTYQANSAMSTRVVESGIYHYSVDLVNMTQTNVDHPAKKMRHIRRTFMGNVTQGTNVGSSTSAAAAASAVTAPMSMAVLAATSVVASTAKSAVQAMSSAAASALALATPTPLTLATPVVPSALAATPRPVDSLCPLASKASMRVVDEYDIMLNQADIVKNANKFYRLQVLIDTSNGGYHFWTRWGRVGEGGQSSLVSNYGNSKASAVADFEKKFKDKTGVKFEDGPPYDAKSGKYEVIDMKVAASSAPVVSAGTAAFSAAGAAVAPPSKLDALTKQFMEIIFDADMFKSAMQDLHVDTTRMPLGALSASQLDKGFSVLRELQALLEKKKKTAQDNAAIVTLSGNFYQVIPHRFARHERPPPINTEDKLSEKFDMLNTLKDIEVAQRVERVGGASLTENPIDAKYRELAAELSLVDTTSGEFGIIKNFIDNTMGYRKVSLQNVWSVSREPEESTFTHFHALRNHRLLWHGTNVAVVAAILKSGLRIMPAVHGGRVGRGLYFADKLEKSTGYVRPTRLADGSQLGVLLLVQAAMGRMKEIT